MKTELTGFVAFPSSYDETISVYLRPAFVAAVEPDSDSSIIHLEGGQEITVRASVEEVLTVVLEALTRTP